MLHPKQYILYLQVGVSHILPYQYGLLSVGVDITCFSLLIVCQLFSVFYCGLPGNGRLSHLAACAFKCFAAFSPSPCCRAVLHCSFSVLMLPRCFALQSFSVNATELLSVAVARLHATVLMSVAFYRLRVTVLLSVAVSSLSAIVLSLDAVSHLRATVLLSVAVSHLRATVLLLVAVSRLRVTVLLFFALSLFQRYRAGFCSKRTRRHFS